jgi:hypothetical protein
MLIELFAHLTASSLSIWRVFINGNAKPAACDSDEHRGPHEVGAQQHGVDYPRVTG